jgi:hypothetical protein
MLRTIFSLLLNSVSLRKSAKRHAYTETHLDSGNASQNAKKSAERDKCFQMLHQPCTVPVRLAATAPVPLLATRNWLRFRVQTRCLSRRLSSFIVREFVEDVCDVSDVNRNELLSFCQMLMPRAEIALLSFVTVYAASFRRNDPSPKQYKSIMLV